MRSSGATAAWCSATRTPSATSLSSPSRVVASRDELWALRYPGTRALHVLERPGRPAGGLHVRNSMSSVHAPDAPPCVVVASERLDGETGWRMLAPGELVHIGPDLRVRSAVVVAGPPARTLGLRGENPNVDT